MLIIEILLIIGLIILNGYFSLSEIALLSVKKSHLKFLAKQGNTNAQKALQLIRQPHEMLATIQTAITAVGIFAGAFSGATVAEHFGEWLSTYEPIAAYGEAIGVALVVLIVTYFSLVIGELVPKQMALANSKKLSLQVAGVITMLMKIFAPMVKLLSSSTTRLLKILRVKPAREQVISEEEIKLLIAEGVDSGVFEKSEQKMVESIFYLGNRPIKDFMTPKKAVIWLDISDTAEIIKQKIKNSDRSVFPVSDKTLDNNLGVVEVKDILTHLFDNQTGHIDLRSLVQPVIYIEPDVPSLVAIERLKRSVVSIVFVKGKIPGEIIGIISFHDILEEIVGEFKKEENEEVRF